MVNIFRGVGMPGLKLRGGIGAMREWQIGFHQHPEMFVNIATVDNHYNSHRDGHTHLAAERHVCRYGYVLSCNAGAQSGLLDGRQ